MRSAARTMVKTAGGGATRLAAALAGVALLAGCAASAATPVPPATPAATTPLPAATPVVTPAPSPSPTPFDDPTTARIEVHGSGNSQQVHDGVGTTVDGVDQSRNGTWKNTGSMSDPLATVQGDMVLNSDLYPDGSGIWWGTLADPQNGWDGITVGVIRSNGVHEGDIVYLGSGASTGQQLRLDQYMGAGADTSNGDHFELTGWYDTLDVPGWTFDPASSVDPAAAIAALVKAWNAGDGASAAELYASAAVYVDATGSSVTGRDSIAARVAATAGTDVRRELVDAVLVRGNVAIAGMRRDEGDDRAMELHVLRFDPAGLVLQQEVVTS